MSKRRVTLVGTLLTLWIANMVALPTTLGSLAELGATKVKAPPILHDTCGTYIVFPHSGDSVGTLVRLMPQATRRCYYQDRCYDQHLIGTIIRCLDVLIPCDLSGNPHSYEVGDRHARFCRMSDGKYCVIHYECNNWTRVRCCDRHFDHCPPQNPSCADETPCPAGGP